MVERPDQNHILFDKDEKMKIFAHDEDSMTNLFFSEVYRHGKIKSFLKLIKWLDYSKIPFNIYHTELHQQVNFSEFGKPDVLIVVTDQSGQKHIVIVEVKLGRYLECSIANRDGKYNNKFNSRLNNQLTLRYRAMQSLSSIEQQGFMTESKHSLESPYSNDQIRRCKKPSTINLLKDIAKEDFQFYLVTLTSDSESPFNDVERSSNLFPIFFDHESGTINDFKNLGSVVWNRCHKLLDNVDNHFSNSFWLHFRAKSEDDDLPESPPIGDLFITGRQIIMYDGEKCLLTYRGYSYAIRHFSNGRFVEKDRGKNDSKKYFDLKNQIRILGKAPSESIENIEYWDNYFAQQKGNDNANDLRRTGNKI